MWTTLPNCHHGPVAQMVEQKIEDLRVGGSIPSWSAKTGI